MKAPMPRRLFLVSSAQLLASTSLLALTRPLYSDQDTIAAPPVSVPPPATRPPPKPPALAPEQVQAVVGLAHRDLAGIRQLVDATPLLANASWDWGGGDFETPLQAAAHTGRRAIAEYLLGRGARLDLYAAAMLGQLDFVKASLALDPRAHEIPGPHGFTLLHCARQGGDQAKPVLDWLLAQGVPDIALRPLPFIWPAGTEPKPA